MSRRVLKDERERALVYREGRTIYFFDEIDEDSICEAIRLLDKIESEGRKKEIKIIISSIGGNCYDGLALYDRIRQSECNILTLGTGLVASMALIVFLAGDERQITENTRLLNHQVSIEDFSGRVVDMKIESKEVEELDDIIVEIISERTGQSIKKLRNETRPGDRWITAEQAVENGYADELIKNTRTYRRRKRA